MTSPWPGAALLHPAVAEDYPTPPNWGVRGNLSAARRRMDVPWGRDLTPPGGGAMGTAPRRRQPAAPAPLPGRGRPGAGALPPFLPRGRLLRGQHRCGTPPCLYLAWRLGGVVVNVDYPLAPEHPYPRPWRACAAVLERVRGEAERWGVDPGAVSLAGDSAGGNLALCLALRTLDRGEPAPAALGLIYPVLQVGSF